VATSAVRDSRNQAEFVERTGRAIGAPVEIIPGREEARLIHFGVQARWPQSPQAVDRGYRRRQRGAERQARLGFYRGYNPS
jgi:hypothetical protein